MMKALMVLLGLLLTVSGFAQEKHTLYDGWLAQKKVDSGQKLTATELTHLDYFMGVVVGVILVYADTDVLPWVPWEHVTPIQVARMVGHFYDVNPSERLMPVDRIIMGILLAAFPPPRNEKPQEPSGPTS